MTGGAARAATTEPAPTDVAPVRVTRASLRRGGCARPRAPPRQQDPRHRTAIPARAPAGPRAGPREGAAVSESDRDRAESLKAVSVPRAVGAFLLVGLVVVGVVGALLAWAQQRTATA